MVYCDKCRHVFPEYKKIGQEIKDAAPHPLIIIIGPVIRIILHGSLATLLNLQTWESALSFLELKKIRSGSRRNALNIAKFPCPICKEFIKWKRGKEDKGRVIWPGDPDWLGGPDRLFLE